MAGNQNQGFDVVYEISTDRFLDILHDLFIDNLPLRLSNLPISLPAVGGLVQTGSFSLPNAPAASMGPITDPKTFTLTLTFAGSSLTLNPVGTIAGLPPTQVGNTTVTLPLAISTATANHRSPITISIPTGSNVTISGPDALPSAVTAALAPIQQAVTQAIRAAFPIVKDIALPTQGPCNIFPQNMALKLLPGSGSGPSALGFFLALEPATVNKGNINAITASALAAGTDAVLTVANTLLLDLVCCLLPQSGEITGLTGTPQTVQKPDETCCQWTNLGKLTIGTTSFDSAPLFEVCIKNGGLSVDGHLKQSGWGWHADITFSLSVTLQNQNGEIVPVLGQPDVHVDADVEWWVYLLALVPTIVGAVVGFLIGGPLGSAGAGIAIGAIVGAIVSALLIGILALFKGLIGTIVGAALGPLAGVLGTLSILPNDLANLIGGLDLIGNPIVDDVRVRGRVVRTPGLALRGSWMSKRGKPTSTEDPEPGLIIIEYESSASGVITAVPTRLLDPIQYQWSWNGTNIGGSGNLPGSTATFQTSGNVCRIQTAMGQDLGGTISVKATDSRHKTLSASSPVEVEGHQYQIKGKPGGFQRSEPLDKQLHSAISEGMGVHKTTVVLK